MRSGLEIEAHHPMRMTLSGPTWPYVSGYRSASFGGKIAERSFFRQPSLAQAFQPGRYVCRMLSVPFGGGLMRRASTKADFASSILPSSAYAATRPAYTAGPR